MTAPGINFTAKWQDRRAVAVLARLGGMSTTPARRQAMRKSLQPVRTMLQRMWRGAPTKMKRKHLRAIASQTRIQIRAVGSGREGIVIGKVGVVYTMGGKQNIWHLLENGWKHPKGKFIVGRYLSKATVATMLPAAVERCADETMRGAIGSQLKQAGWRVA